VWIDFDKRILRDAAAITSESASAGRSYSVCSRCGCPADTDGGTSSTVSVFRNSSDIVLILRLKVKRGDSFGHQVRALRIKPRSAESR